MTSIQETGGTQGGAFAPLRERTFRTIWIASLFSNFGQLILGVGVAWEMTRLTNSPSMVALVQTAMMVPIMLVAVPAGAIADMFDRRKIAMVGLGFSMISAASLAALAFSGLATPWLLLAFCVLIGAGVALFSPAWQASISEQVEAEHLPAAVALGTISYNVARSFGPAIGGLIVLKAGSQATFATTALCYLPLLAAFFFWQRRHISSRLPPERMDRAIVSGARYALFSGPIRTILTRVFVFGCVSATAGALAPLIAKDILHGNADTFGLLLGASGAGAVGGALLVNRIRDQFATETSVRIFALFSGLSLIAIGFSKSLILTMALLAVTGAANILTIALLNVCVQLSAPRWVTARALSLYSSAMTGGIAFGSWVWGSFAASTSVEHAMIGSGIALTLTPLMGLARPLPASDQANVDPVSIGTEPDVGLALTMRSGPVVIELDYDVDPDQARDFYDAMLAIQRVRLRNGSFGWSLSRDIADPALWTERYECPTWGDYLRTRDRFTQADQEAQALANSFHRTSDRPRVRRKLVRPFGSVRWRADTPDPRRNDITLITP